MRKLLVTGASGFLGWTLCSVAKTSWQTFGTVLHKPLVPEGVRMCRADLTQERIVRDLFSSVVPDAVVHTAALSSPDYCETHPGESESVNVAASKLIASICAEYAIPCVFTSTDLVFDGEHAPYDEESAANPISTYGEHKLLAEELMRRTYPETTICRLPLMFGVGNPATPGMLRRMLESMATGEEVHLFVDEIRTPVSTETAASGLLLALDHLRGTTVHLGGPESISRWELGQLAADIFIRGKPRLVPCRQKDAKSRAPRARDVSLKSVRATQIGYLPNSVREQMTHIQSMMEIN